MTDRVCVYKGAERIVTLRRDPANGLALRVKLRPGRNTEAMLRQDAQAFGDEATKLERGELSLVALLEAAPNLTRLREAGDLVFEDAPTGARAKRQAAAPRAAGPPAGETVGEILARASASVAERQPPPQPSTKPPAPSAAEDKAEPAAWNDKSRRDDLVHAMATRGLEVPEGYTRAQMIDDLRAWDDLQAEADRPAEPEVGASEADRPAERREAEADRLARIDESRTIDRIPIEPRPPEDSGG